jgi:hypothetical protein
MSTKGGSDIGRGAAHAVFTGRIIAAIAGTRGEWIGIVWKHGDPGRIEYGPCRTKTECQRMAAYYAGEMARATVGAVQP